MCFYGGDKENRSHVCVCCDEGCPAMNEGKRRWAAAEEGQGWRRQQRARASLGSSCAPQEGSNMRMVAKDGPSQSCLPPEAACVSSCKQHKPSRANSPAVPRSEVSPRFYQQAHNGLMTSTCCIYEGSGAVPAHKRMKREQPQNNATQHHQHYGHRQQQRREDMGCSAQGVQLPAYPHIHRPCISNDACGVQLAARACD